MYFLSFSQSYSFVFSKCHLHYNPDTRSHYTSLNREMLMGRFYNENNLPQILTHAVHTIPFHSGIIGWLCCDKITPIIYILIDFIFIFSFILAPLTDIILTRKIYFTTITAHEAPFHWNSVLARSEMILIMYIFIQFMSYKC